MMEPKSKNEALKEKIEAQRAKFNAHDEHYRKLESEKKEPIIRMEEKICNEIPVEFHLICKRNLNLAMCEKHTSRAGEKKGEDWKKELEKAENYLHRARTGNWIGKDEKATVYNTPIIPFWNDEVVIALANDLCEKQKKVEKDHCSCTFSFIPKSHFAKTSQLEKVVTSGNDSSLIKSLDKMIENARDILSSLKRKHPVQSVKF